MNPIVLNLTDAEVDLMYGMCNESLGQLLRDEITAAGDLDKNRMTKEQHIVVSAFISKRIQRTEAMLFRLKELAIGG